MAQFRSEVLCTCSLYQVQCSDFFELCLKKLWNYLIIIIHVLNMKEQQKTSPAFFLSTSLPSNCRFFLLDLCLRISNFFYVNNLNIFCKVEKTVYISLGKIGFFYDHNYTK